MLDVGWLLVGLGMVLSGGGRVECSQFRIETTFSLLLVFLIVILYRN